MRRFLFSLLLVIGLSSLSLAAGDAVGVGDGSPLPGTERLTLGGDIVSRMLDGVDHFLQRQLERSVEQRAQFWNRDHSSPQAYEASIAPNRRRLAHMLGVRDPRVPFDAPELMATTDQPALVGQGGGFEIFAVRWPVLAFPGPSWPASVSIHGEGLLLVPTGQTRVADVIAIPDADQTPEQIVGLMEGVGPESQFARHLARSGCRVLVPTLISREIRKRNGRAMLTNREYVYRSAFVLGRHVIGYEIQKVLAGVDWFASEAERQHRHPKIGVIGYGEGGMLALYAAALDRRIDVTVVSGYFGPRDQVWEEPLDRNVFGRLREFGDAELASMIAPRKLVIDAAPGPEITLPGEGGAPARLRTPPRDAVEAEVNRARMLAGPLWNEANDGLQLVEDGPFGSKAALAALLADSPEPRRPPHPGTRPQNMRPQFDPAARQQRQLDDIDRHNQWLLRESPFVRKEFMQDLDTTSLPNYERSIEPYRVYFRDKVIGRFDIERLPPRPRSRKVWETDKWSGYEVVLDVFPLEPQPGREADPEMSSVIAYGVLLLPKDLKEREQRPVVVCQHGLEGRPTDTFLNDHRAYHDFAAKLCERGFITFAPQNVYIFRDRFRSLQRKANPLGKTLFSILVPQHQQIVDWLQTLPFVDPERIAFYGLSYGGKSAMRIPALVPDYCLSLCSADFNEWVLKNASTREDFSYVWTGEYEIFEWDLGSTFNYAEMAALICPRPFMVERGHFDGVGTDEWVAYEFAKVRRLYQAQLGIGDRCEIEWFVGPHTINGQGTFEFLHRHLNWPRP